MFLDIAAQIISITFLTNTKGQIKTSACNFESTNFYTTIILK